MTKRTVGFLLLASVALAAGPVAAEDGVTRMLPTGLCAEMSANETRADADEKIADMRIAVDEVKDMRDAAQASGSVSEYQQLNNLYTQMNSRLLVAEQARDNQEESDDPAILESDCGLIDAAYTSVMGSRDAANRVINGGVEGGDFESLTGGADGLPSYDTTTRGRTITPDGAEDGREDSSFGRGTPFS